VTVAVDTGVALRGDGGLRPLVEAVVAAGEHDEADWLEWKATLDLSTKAGAFAVARTVLGLANRPTEQASLTCEGVGYLVVGAEPGRLEGMDSVDLASFGQLVHPYLGGQGLRWSPAYVAVREVKVFVATVEAPRPGDPIYTLRKEAPAPGALSGTVFVRKPGRTLPADAADMDALQARLLARTSPDPVEVEFMKRRLEELLDTLREQRATVVRFFASSLGVTPRSGDLASLAFNQGCDKVESQLDAMGALGQRLPDVRFFAQNKQFNTQGIDQAKFQTEKLLREIAQ
jgi:hypothetical protein